MNQLWLTVCETQQTHLNENVKILYILIIYSFKWQTFQTGFNKKNDADYLLRGE